MKYVIPEISWHGRDPVYSVDLQHTTGDVRRLATCGTDRLVRLWMVTLLNDQCQTKQSSGAAVEFLSTLSRHSRTVNVVRFSPDGTMLASGADDATVILWKLSDLSPATCFIQDDEEENRETWTAFKMLRSHLEDVYDISWSSDSKLLLSGSVDNTAILWDVDKGQKIWMFSDHKSFVQGVALDPVNQFIATVSDDRCLRIFTFGTRQLLHAVRKLPVATGKSRMFHSADTMKSFFRRLAFSPDGQLLIVPAGCWENPQNVDAGFSNATYVFCRNNLSRPVLSLIGSSKPTLAVRFCPLLFKLRTNLCPASGTEDMETNDQTELLKCETLFRLPYRMIFAVASENEVLLYDTQQEQPIAYFANLHYHTLSDLTWSHDGRLLVISSTDGYCTLVSFDVEELGITYAHEELCQPKPNETSLLIKERDDILQDQQESIQNNNVHNMPAFTTASDDLNLILEVSNDVSHAATDLTLTLPSPAIVPVASTTFPKLVNNLSLVTGDVETSSKQTVDVENMPKVPSIAAANSGKNPRRIQLTTITTNVI